MKPSVVAQLRAARLRRGMTQREVARAMATTQSAVARFERSAISPKLATVEAFGAAVGHTVSIGPRDLLGDAARALTDRLGAEDADGALRVLVQLHDELVRGDGTVDPWHEPPSTGARTWDAALAAVVERVCRSRGEPVPGWTAAPSRFLDHPWLPLADILGGDLPAGLACLALASSPPEFAARGVHLDPTTFDSR